MTRTGRWIEVSTEVDGEAVEAVAEAFSRFTHGGVVIEYPTDPGPEIAWNEEPVIARDRPVIVRGYVPRSREGRRRLRQLEETIWHLGQLWPVATPTSREVDEADWANAWKAHFPVLRVGRRIVIRPTWRRHRRRPDDVVIALDPGMAFGTGLHPTTRLCLAALESMACELPVAASRVGGLPEIVDDEVGGLFEPADPRSLADVVVRLLESGQLEALGRRARARVVENWSNDRLAERHLEIYRTLLARRKQS